MIILKCKDKKEYSKFIVGVCDEISNLTEEQYEKNKITIVKIRKRYS